MGYSNTTMAAGRVRGGYNQYGFSVGILMQEPVLDESKTVLENVQEGVGPIMAKLARFNEISLAMAEPDADFDTLEDRVNEQGTLVWAEGTLTAVLMDTSSGDILPWGGQKVRARFTVVEA